MPSATFLSTLPGWAATLARTVAAKQANTFVIHGLPADLIPVRQESGLVFQLLDDFLTDALFASWPSKVTYNRAEGLGFASQPAKQHFVDRLKAYDAVHGTSWGEALPRDAANAFALLDSYFRHCATLAPARPVVLILPFAETLVPNGDASYRTPEDRAVLVYLRKWAQDPVLLAKNIVVVLVTESLAELDPKLVRASATREVEIPRPDLTERREYLETVRPPEWFGRLSEVPPPRLAELTAGMTRAQLAQLLDGAEAAETRLTLDGVRAAKKEVIETEGMGLLEYVEPKYDLDMVAGMPAVKGRLRRAARAIARGNPSAVPMGYLICGPVGSAKTFLVECFSREIGFPCVKLKNFRSMWVGSTEGESRAHPQDPRLADAGRRGHRRGRCRARQSRTVGRFRHPAAGLRADRELHGRHPPSRQGPLVPDHRPARPAADRPQAPGEGGGAHPAVLSRDLRRVRRDLSGDEEEAQAEQQGRELLRTSQGRPRSRATRARTSKRSWYGRFSKPRQPIRARSPRSTSRAPSPTSSRRPATSSASSRSSPQSSSAPAASSSRSATATSTAPRSRCGSPRSSPSSSRFDLRFAGRGTYSPAAASLRGAGRSGSKDECTAARRPRSSRAAPELGLSAPGARAGSVMPRVSASMSLRSRSAREAADPCLRTAWAACALRSFTLCSAQRTKKRITPSAASSRIQIYTFMGGFFLSIGGRKQESSLGQYRPNSRRARNGAEMRREPQVAISLAAFQTYTLQGTIFRSRPQSGAQGENRCPSPAFAPPLAAFWSSHRS